MATIKSEIQTEVEVTVTNFASLASATYCASNAINHTTNDPLDVLVRVSAATTNTPAGNKQIVVFAKASLNAGTTFTSGPETGTTTTDEPDLHFVGVLPINTATTVHSKVFSLAGSFGGVLPQQTKIILKNDLGVALTSANLYTSEIWGVSV